MSGIGLNFLEEKKKLPIGASKFFGNPDVWDGFGWPQFTEGGESYDLTFMCQINCADATPFDKDSLLPQSGILYFFYDMDEMPKESVNMKTSRVLYYEGELSNLCEMLRTDHEGNDMSLPVMKINFDSSEYEQGHALLGSPFADGWQPLLRIHSFETDKVNVRFANKNALCFCVDEEKLKHRDFSEIFIRQV